MSRAYKNILKLRGRAFGVERRNNLAKEVVKDSTPLPLPVEYKDIDDEFKRWVDEDLDMSFEGERIPTIALFSNQRFGEYMQTWQKTDDKRNLLMNFKTITRENNPKSGTIVGDTKNIPGERTALMRRVEVHDRAGRKYYIDYRMKQPMAIDMIYTVSVVTNKYEFLNGFNQMMNDKFKSIDCYIRPNGHFMPMKLTNISDESQYSIDNRQYYSQSYDITVMAYIIKEDDLVVEERPNMLLMGFEGDDGTNTYAEIDELPCDYYHEPDFDFMPVVLSIHFDPCDSKYEFKIDSNFHAKNIITDNIRYFRIFVNDVETKLDENFSVKTNDSIKIKTVVRKIYNENAEIRIEGYDPTDSYKKDEPITQTVIEYS